VKQPTLPQPSAAVLLPVKDKYPRLSDQDMVAKMPAWDQSVHGDASDAHLHDTLYTRMLERSESFVRVLPLAGPIGNLREQ
jgi:hypothetical protein